MMMKMLEAGGIPPLTDKIRTADDDNPKGYYEFERVKALDKGDTEWVVDAQGKTVKVISALLKHLPSGYPYRVVYIRRNMTEILASQRKMLLRRGEARPIELVDAAIGRIEKLNPQLGAVISPQFVRLRDDKQAHPKDVRLAQVSDRVEVASCS